MKVIISNLNNEGIIRECIKRTDRYCGKVQKSITLDIDMSDNIDVRLHFDLGDNYTFVSMANGDIVIRAN